MQHNSDQLVDSKIKELEDKLYELQQRERQGLEFLATKSHLYGNTDSWQKSLELLQKQAKEVEDQLVTLFREHPQKLGVTTIQGEQLSMLSGDDEVSSIREKIRTRLKAREDSRLATLQTQLAAAREVLGDSEAFRQIVRAVQAPDNSDEAGNAILALRKLADKRMLEPLLGFLKLAGSPGFWAAQALSRLFSLEELLPALTPRLSNPDPEVRLHTIVTFSYLGQTFRFPDRQNAFELNGSLVTGQEIDDRILKLLLPLLDDPDSQVRARAVSELCHLGDKRATEKLVLALEDPSPKVRQCAAAFLGSLGDERAIEPLLKALHSGDKEVESRASQSLGMLGYQGEGIENPWARLAETMGEITAGLSAVLGQVNPRRKKQKVEEGGFDKEISGFLTRFNRQVAPDGVASLVAKLKDPIASARADAAERLGILRDAQAVEPLIAALDDQDLQVRNQVISALGRIGDKTAVEPLLALLEDKDWYSRSLAVEALGRLEGGSGRIVPALLPLLDDPVEEIRSAAVLALANLGPGEASLFEPLRGRLDDKSEKVVISAITALGRLGDRRGLEPLLEQLKSEDVYRRITAAEALGELGDEQALPDLQWARDNDPYRDEDGYCVHNSAGKAIEQILADKDGQ
ncbi:MAG TPA: HEAT repeat domain-containing protein [Chloroflexia bacterium]|nr:HEAT repeat domain-containing protein [Chloroflexia bacterium]